MTNFIRKPFRYKFFNATIIIAAINVLMFVITTFNQNLRYLLGLNAKCFIEGRMYWQIFTCIFIHGNFQHLFFNMLGLLMFGIPVEKSLGSKEFLLLYLLCGTVSSAFSLVIFIFTGQYYVFLIGASGAIYSILLAFTVIFPTVRVFIFGILPVPGPVLIIIYTIIEIGSQLFGISNGVAHMTHLFGFVAVWLYFVIRMGVNPITVWKNALRR